MNDAEILEWVKARISVGETLMVALAAIDCSYTKWARIYREAGIHIPYKRGKPAKTYTPDRVELVRQRIQNGEFLRDIARDLGMDSKNLARYCRRNGIQLFSDEDLKKNYLRRKKTTKGRKKDNSPLVLAIKADILAGMKPRDIAKKHGVKVYKIHYLKRTLQSSAKT